jgi:16S rRNA (guanine527-N7)-methyltransferase
MPKMIEKKFKLILQENNINFDELVLTNLAKYCQLLQEYNQKFNLTALVSTEDIYLKHFLDSIITTKYFRLDTFPDLVDVGTGAGFPGLILKIFNPGLRLVLVESNSKKCQFFKSGL